MTSIHINNNALTQIFERDLNHYQFASIVVSLQLRAGGGYELNIKHICLNPEPTMAQKTPDPGGPLQFRAKIKLKKVFITPLKRYIAPNSAKTNHGDCTMSGLSFSKSAFLKATIGHKSWYKNGKFELDAEQFLAAYYDDAIQNDAIKLTKQNLIDLADEFWMLGGIRKVGESIVRIRRIDVLGLGAHFDALELITDDRRFLVDSVIGEISDHGIDVVALFHPVASGFRNEKGLWRRRGTAVRESMIQIVFPKQSTAVIRAIRKGVENTLQDIAIVIDDFQPMLSLLRQEITILRAQHGKVDSDVVDESVAFLNWILEGNFVLLGSRTYQYQCGRRKSEGGKGRKYDYVNPLMIDASCFGVLRDKSRVVLRQSREPSSISSNTAAFLREKDPVTVAKSNILSKVHRRVRMDYISIKHYTREGRVKGETRFVGLFTANAYEHSPKLVPLLRRKIDQVIKRYNAEPGSHNAERLDFVLSTYPRDELFQISEDELFRIASGVAQAYDRPRTRLFVREDPFKRFISILVYVPRENYSSTVRKRIGEHLCTSYGGRVSAFYPQYSDSPLARVHFIIGLDLDACPDPDVDQLERDVTALARPWFANVEAAADEQNEDAFFDVLPAYRNAFQADYQSRFDGAEALTDIKILEALSSDNPTNVRLYAHDQDTDTVLRVKFYSLGRRLEPSYIMPIFANMNLHIAQETGYEVNRANAAPVWIHDYEMQLQFQHRGDREKLAQVFCDAFLAIWHGENDDDGFNALILSQNVNWRRIAVLRLIARFRKQSGMDPSEDIQIEALLTFPEITADLLKLFTQKFDPAIHVSRKSRLRKVEAIEKAIVKKLDQVPSLEHDRVLRRMTDTLLAALRTNFYTRGEDGRPQPSISLKIDSMRAGNLPDPTPDREIFVWSPRVEGVHLRFGPVARGGLRWSDRRDDFRTEILGLVKAQQAKNAVIVPVGSKGGFFPKKLPDRLDREAFMAEGIAAYTEFIRGLLDITDSYEGSGIRQPKNVITWDDPDPYLVVAADKGTAMFSDIANGIAREYGFWLDDAFASGGSVGYDHKAMGITARGGWEAVKRHFREIGKDIQNEDFDVIGVGDMSGDVFGNGMLLSKHIKLLAAFDHRDIFIDPDPNAVKTFAERKRLFEMSRSSWQDFNKKLISKGGGVFSRSSKSIALNEGIKKLTGLVENEVSPNALIRALLKTPCELLWFGGIGTYIKSSDESHADASDKSNDPVRINGLEVGAQVIGEGANLGITQAGRTEFAQKGGRLNTDAIDNSAGVDCSDNEVNIKILLNTAIEEGELMASLRNRLLEDMTENVAELVLARNYDQTGALSLAEKRVREDHFVYVRLIETLEQGGHLEHVVEGLPDNSELQRRYKQGGGLTRPELAVLNACAKIKLYDRLMQTDIAEDPHFDRMLCDYFPEKTQDFKKALASHRLRREIIISRLSNRMIDVGGPAYMIKLDEQTSANAAKLAKTFTIAWEVMEIARIRDGIKALDNRISADAQTSLHEEIALVLQRVIGWLVKRAEKEPIATCVERRANGLSKVDESWANVLSTYDNRRTTARIGRFMRDCVPRELAQDVALLRPRATCFDVIELTEKTGWSVRKSAELFYGIGGRFKIDRLRSALQKLTPETQWDELARRRIEEDFYAVQAVLARDAAKPFLKKKGCAPPAIRTVIDTFVQKNTDMIGIYNSAFTKISASGGWTLAKFAIINAQLRELLGV